MKFVILVALLALSTPVYAQDVYGVDIDLAVRLAEAEEDLMHLRELNYRLNQDNKRLNYEANRAKRLWREHRKDFGLLQEDCDAAVQAAKDDVIYENSKTITSITAILGGFGTYALILLLII
jgi:hypothetical protein